MSNLKSPKSKRQTTIKTPNTEKAQIEFTRKLKYDKKPKFKMSNYNKKAQIEKKNPN
jgi:hypothetical protein